MSAGAVAKAILVAAGVVAGLYVLYRIRAVIGLLVIAVFIAVALGPAVDWFERRGVRRRGLAILTTYLWLFFAVLVVGLAVVPPIVDQTDDFARNVPSYVDDLSKNETVRDYDKRYGISKELRAQAERLPTRLDDAASALQAVTVGVFSTLVQLITVLVMAFFLLLEGKSITAWLFGELGPARGPRWRNVADDVYRSVGGYVVGNLGISLVAGLSTYVVLTVLGVRFAVPLAVLMAFFDLIPLVGATIAAILIGIVTAIEDFPTAMLVWIAFAILYQQFENNLLQPFVYRRTVALHPLLVIVAILIGANLLGVLGALLAIPIAGAAQIVVKDWWAVRKQQPSPLLTEPQPPAAGGGLPEPAS
ncbi:MAG TPA: AI-2E family transporter [Gemmatimonadaceae bacterium]|nr:AI-2E family transporter [Gemmatimonadaceae bacterium]